MLRVPSPRFVRFAFFGMLLLSGCSRSGAGTERSLQDPASTTAPESSPSTNVPQAARTAEAPSAASPPAASTTPTRAPIADPHAGHGHAAAPSATPGPATTAAAKATYSCPMHPEVQKDSPGSCPKCGMNLVKK